MIILASESPRRIELLSRIGLRDVEVIPSKIDENFNENIPPEEIVCELAWRKALSARTKAQPLDIVIAADTLVVIDGSCLGKPADPDDAARMLKMLSGKKHQVFTGVAVIRGDTIICEYEETWVFFRKLSDADVQRYIRTGECSDKAGAYGIQELGSTLVECIEGDYYNVMGLPLCLLAHMLRQVGLDILEN